MRVRMSAKNTQLDLKFLVDETGSPRTEGVAAVVERQTLVKSVSLSSDNSVSENLASEARF